MENRPQWKITEETTGMDLDNIDWTTGVGFVQTSSNSVFIVGFPDNKGLGKIIFCNLTFSPQQLLLLKDLKLDLVMHLHKILHIGYLFLFVNIN